MSRAASALLASAALLSCGRPDPAGVAATALPPPRSPPAGMVWIPGGSFLMGSADGLPDERPLHRVRVSGFFLDAHEVTNAEFRRFVEATGYVTLAERTPSADALPDVPPERRVPGALVFAGESPGVSPRDVRRLWRFVAGADWRHPDGPGSSLEGRWDHPVVQVCWEDAQAYAHWAGKRLPTEAEWEYAARGGLVRARYPWGDDLEPGGRPAANVWQGPFPARNDRADGFFDTAPVGSFPPNGFGLFDMAGNVWEWCEDVYRADAYTLHAARDPRVEGEAFDPAQPGVPLRVLRGGSFLCAENACRGYRVAARMKSSPDTGLRHVGFRCAMDP